MNPKDWSVGSAIGLLLIGGFLAATAGVFFKGYPADPGAVAMLTALSNLAMLVASFFYGSSTSSKTKDETIANLTQPGPKS